VAVPQIQIDLQRPPAERWNALHPYLDEGRQLLAQYATDLGGIAQFHDMIGAYRDAYIEADNVAELAAIAQMIGASSDEVLVVNLYYDMIKFVLGCTAFAVDTDHGPLHARNLDWWTDNALLARSTVVVHMQGATAGPFHLVSWPGFIGALSGVAPGRFAISLNAVLSDEPPAFAPPITFVLRSVFETARTFTEAVDRLMAAKIASDCLLLVTGTQLGEMVVVERTPTRAAVRHPNDGCLVVANDYLGLSTSSTTAETEQELQRTSYGRFERATALLAGHMPQSAADCFAVLTDPAVRMRITVQHMVLSATQGLVDVRLPADQFSVNALP